MKIRTSMRHWLALPVSMALAALAACGGSEDAAPPSASVTVGAAGGTVNGPSGLQLVVPAGALAQPVALSIAQTAVGAPALPAGSTALGATFALTPHGTVFAVPVTVRVPFDPSLLLAGQTLALWKTNAAQDAWQAVPGATVSGNLVQAQIDSFSWFTVTVAGAPVSTTPSVIGGFDISYMLKANGQVYRTSGGIGGVLTPVAVPGMSDVISIAAGSRHLLMLRANGSVWAWGDNLQGQLGDGTRTPRTTTPVEVITAATPIVAIAAGVFTSVALKRDGTLLEWGVDPSTGSIFTGLRLLPVAVPGFGNVVAVTVAHGDPLVGDPDAIGHVLALRDDGTVWAWGYNGDGALGDGTQVSRATPAPVSGLTNVTMITAGERFSLARRSDDTVWGWGYNNANVLPGVDPLVNTTPQLLSIAPRPVPGLPDIDPTGPLTALVAGHDHVLALRGGYVITWGDNLHGQLGVNLASTQLRTNGPAVTARPPNVAIAIGAGSDHSLAIDVSGDVWTWGHNVLGQLGDGTTTQRNAPVQVPGLNLN